MKNKIDDYGSAENQEARLKCFTNKGIYDILNR